MQSWLISFGRSLAPRWLLIAAVAFLLSMFFLIGNLYSSQVELRQNADARLVSIGEARATEIGDFLIERRQAAARLAASEDISNYFSNLDLGMSVKYGLFANLAAIERRFQATMDEEKYQGQPAYLRLAFFDRNGVVQVDVGASSAATPSPAGNNLAEPNIQIDDKRRLIVASVPVLQKGKIRGTVETVSSLNLLSSLVSTNDLGQPHEFLLGDDGEVLLPIEREHSAIVTQGLALAALPSGRIQALSNLKAPELKGYLALRSPVAASRAPVQRKPKAAVSGLLATAVRRRVWWNRATRYRPGCSGGILRESGLASRPTSVILPACCSTWNLSPRTPGRHPSGIAVPARQMLRTRRAAL